jgi:hypothetical protein
MIFKPNKVDKARVQEQYLEKICHKKGRPSNSKKKGHQEASKEEEKKWEGGKDKKTISTAHKCKYPRNHYNMMVTPRKSIRNYI